MTNFMRLRGTALFWQQVEAVALAGDDASAHKAQWMLLARQNFPIRRWISTELSRARYRPGYAARLNVDITILGYGVLQV